MEFQQLLLLSGLALAVFLLVRTLLRRNRSNTSLIDLDDLLIGDDGKLSKAAVVLFGSFTVASWVIVYQVYKGVLTDVTFAAYLATFVAPTITKLWKSTDATNSNTPVG